MEVIINFNKISRQRSNLLQKILILVEEKFIQNLQGEQIVTSRVRSVFSQQQTTVKFKISQFILGLLSLESNMYRICHGLIIVFNFQESRSFKIHSDESGRTKQRCQWLREDNLFKNHLLIPLKSSN